MEFKTIVILVLCLLCHTSYTIGSTSKNIPDFLLHCYRNGGINITSPLNVQLLVEILSKIEYSNPNYNIRVISSSLLHSLRQDGIERAPNIKESDFVTPFRSTSFQYAKYSFLLDLLIPGENLANVYNGLSLHDICAIHMMISSTVDRWERGDETRICPLSMTMHSTNFCFRYSQPLVNRSKIDPGLSRCPIEKGVVQTSWGDVSAGTLLSAISAALEPQNILLSEILESITDRQDEHDFDKDFDANEFVEEFEKEMYNSFVTSEKYISNVLAATLSGDLAEVIVRQGPYVESGSQPFIFGSWTKWNDTILPRNLYLMQEPSLNWEMTNAEIIGGIDGFIIANYMKDWATTVQNIRLSQIIEMYYSNYGVAFNRNIRACNRKQNFAKLVRDSNLQEQTSNMANFLWLKTGFVFMKTKDIENLSNFAVRDFEQYWPKLMDSLPGCDIKEDTNQVEAVVVTDGTWTKYQTEQFISIISETFDVSNHGSSMGLLHGTTGEWISTPTHSLVELFNNIVNYSESWTSRLDLPAVLTSIIERLENITQEESETFKVVGLPRVVIVVTPTGKIPKDQLERSVTIMNTLRSNYMDVYFTYVMTDEEAFEALAMDPRKYSDVLVKNSNTDVKEVAEMVRLSLIKNVTPKRFSAPPCDLTRASSVTYQHEDYINVGQQITYRIHPSYMMWVQVINIQFQGTDQGEISVCISRKNTEEAAESCKIVSGQYDAAFQIKRPCNGNALCDPVYFIVRARSTAIKCTDKDCRYPDQIRFMIRHDGLECLRGNGTSSAMILHRNAYDNIYFSFITILNMFLFNKIISNK
ncbi:uncharacterized protein LOC143918440 isoform X2 [Arctopsyche grandis]|uniref:uncharacterized protein LOC143918440 isoform X2 n=1 Tax=Arctopsyche grandis TaxID=121162 RepID=UPI00406D6D77